MLDESTTTTDDQSVDQPTSTPQSASTAEPRAPRRRAASRPAGPPEAAETDPSDQPGGASDESTAEAEVPAAKRAPAKKSAGRKSAGRKSAGRKSAAKKTTKKTTAKKATKKTAATQPIDAEPATDTAPADVEPATVDPATVESSDVAPASPPDAWQPDADDSTDSDLAADADFGPALFAPVFQPPDPVEKTAAQAEPERDEPAEQTAESEPDEDDDESDESDESGRSSSQRRRRRRGGRRRRRSSGDSDSDEPAATDGAESTDASSASESSSSGSGSESADSDGSTPATRRRRRRRRRGEDTEPAPDDPANTVVRVREPRGAEDEITALEGSTRMEAKKQRRREGRAAGRRRAPIVSEAEFLARRESVKREMVIRQRADVTQIAVLEDEVLVEHYVARDSQTSLIGNVYVGRVQNVLPSMEAAFIDIGKGRNAVLYAGEVDWNALGMEGKPHRIEDALKSGQTVLVQVTKDPVGHKGARLTGQISLPGRFLVYVPRGHTSGISRKLPDTERSRLKDLLKQVVPEDAGVIVRTAAEGATEDQLNRDVMALTARWDDISQKSEGGQAPQLLYAEPDLMLKVVRDLFNEDFASLVVDGDDAWDTIEAYVAHVAPDLAERLERWTGGQDGSDEGAARDVFADYRIDEQIAKALDRKVWLPSGGSLIIDRTEAMTVIDVNTGKFTGSGGNLEETVTKNNLEAAEEVVRQLRLRDIGGIIVIDFIDMVLESNRDLVLRRLVECLGRDRTRHQVAEVTSLGLVQMTRKRIGTGLLEAFSEQCEHCKGRGVLTHSEPIEPKPASDNGTSRRRGKRGPGGDAKSTKAGDAKSTKGGGDAKSTKKSSSRRKSSKDGAGKPKDGPDKPKNGPDKPKNGPDDAPAEPAGGTDQPSTDKPAEPAEPVTAGQR